MHPEKIKLLNVYLSRFCNRLDAYYQQWANSTAYGYRAVFAPVTLELLYLHLYGTITIGWPALDSNGFGKWICFDSDTADGKLDSLQTFLKQHSWYCIREGKRSGRDGHLWLLFDAPIPGDQLRILAQAMMRGAGVSIGEYFPKQAKPGKLGSQVRGPLGKHLKPGANGRRGWFEGAAKDIKSQLIWLAEQPLNSSTIAIELAHEHRPIPKPLILRQRNYDKNKIDFIAWGGDNGFSQAADELIGPCPACIAFYGHDPTHEHLSINVIKGVVHCWRGCTFDEILKAIKSDILKTA
jgi:hypothetical protein